MALTALSVAEPAAITAAISRYAAGHGVGTDVLGPEAVNDEDVATVSPPEGGWTVIAWPTYFAGLTAASEWLSSEFGTVASAMTFYDGDFWQHVAYRYGVERDRFTSMPDHFADDPAEVASLRWEWAGNADVLEELFGCPAAAVAPYLAAPDGHRAFPDDAFDLDDPWVFVDFWRRLGIRYPDPASGGTVERCVKFLPPGSVALPIGGPRR
jgi:hypothetical protein